MYGCGDNIKGCLSVAACRIDNRLSVVASTVIDSMNVSVKPIGKRVFVTCSLICTINKTPYLKVNPDYIWLTPEMLSSGEFDIISNVNWNIV